MKNSSWKKRKKIGKKLLPLFAPLILSPVTIPAGASSTSKKIDNKRLTSKKSNLKIAKFDQIAYKIYNEMDLQEQGLRYEVFSKALLGYYNLKHEDKLSDNPVVTIVDFTKSSNEKRLWVINLEEKQVLHNTYVAHGRNSGNEFAENFSNDHKSYMSSIGFYVTQGTYQGKHGLSLRLDGLDEANSNALDRCIVMHGAEYASEDFIEQAGRLGRSLGCPALPMEEHEGIINAVKDKTTLYIHAENDAYTSNYLDHANAMAELIEDQQKEAPVIPSKLTSI
jgi:hypothetical protein